MAAGTIADMTAVLQRQKVARRRPPRPNRGTSLGPGRILRRAVRREVAVPLLIALAGLSVAVLTKSLLGYADWIVNRGLGVGTVGWIALLELVPVFAQTLPFALLIGVLVALGRLKADLELLAMESLGVARIQLVRPVLALALLGAGAAALLSIWAAPASKGALEARLETLRRERPDTLLRAGVVAEFDGRQLLARDVSADGSALQGVLLWMPDLGEAVFGERGRLEGAGEGATRLTLHLEDAALLGTPAEGVGGQHVQVARFETHLDLTPAEAVPGDGIAAIPTSALLEGGAEREDARRRQAELHRRFAQPMAALLLGLLAVPLALANRSTSRSSGAVAGLLLTAAYYGVVQLGEALLREPQIPVAVGVWLAPAATLVLLIALLRRLALWGFDEEPDRVERDPAEARVSDRPVGVRGVLDRYVLSVYLGSALISMGVLFLAYFAIDLLERLDWFAKHQAELLEIAQFYAARVPLLASRVIPMALLVGSALTVSLLAARNELIALQACGIRLGRAFLPVVVASALAVPATFWINDRVVTRTNALADRIKVERIKDRATGHATEAWYRSDGQVVRASRSGLRGGVVPDLVVFELGPDGLPAARIRAREARRIEATEGEGGDTVWQLVDAEAILISDRGLRVVEAPTQYALGIAREAAVDPMHHSTESLAEEIRAARQSGVPVIPLRVDWHRKLASPVACLILPLLALVVSVRSRRRPSAARTVLASAAFGVAYLLAGDVAASLGYGGQISPAAAGWAPPTLALFGAAALMVRPRA